MTLNIEGNRHLDKVLPFLKKMKPDVICLQELFAVDAPRFEAELRMDGVFFPLCRVEKENKYNISPRGLWGLGLFTKLAHTEMTASHYKGRRDHIPVFSEPNSNNRVLLTTTVTKSKQRFNIGTTHFTWSGDGQATLEQHRDFTALMKLVQEFDDLVLAGDFNAPRGGQIFSAFEQHFKDRLPKRYDTTIDPDHHYAGPLKLVVDTIFTTSGYKAKNVKTHGGVSDHQAVSGDISLAASARN